MKDYKARFENLISDAAECELIGNLATEASKRNTLRRLAEQFRTIAMEVKAEMDGGSSSSISDRDFLLRNAKDFRDLAASCGDEGMRNELLRMAADCEEKAVQED